jgi:aryl-alcohol dehydrogenase-like predicted oxidoreductase
VKDAGSRIVALCRSRGLDPSAVALKFCLDYVHVASTLVGMSSQTHVKANLEALDFNLEPDLLAAIQRVIGDDKDVVWPSGRVENSDYALH